MIRQIKNIIKRPYYALKRFTENYSVPAMPKKLMIEPTSFCNISCPTCPTGNGKLNRNKRHMSLVEFKDIINQAKGYVKDITLWNYGEPFLNSSIIDMISYAKVNGMKVITSTNGQFFENIDYCKKIVESGLDRLLICLDGADQQTINKFRKNADFSSIINGIRLMVSAKKKLISPTPKIELQFIVMKHNEHQRNIIRALAKELNVDVYSEKTVGIDANDPDFQKMCKALLPKDLSLSRYYVTSEGKYALKGSFTNYCSFIYLGMVINSDGSVVPCCYDLYSDHILGNVFNDSISSIWRSKKYQEFRLKLRKDRKSIPICTICSEGMPISKRNPA